MDEETGTVEDIVEMRSGSMARLFEELTETRKTVSGVYVSPEASLSCAAVLACVRVLSESVASLPFNVYRRLPGGGKEIAEDLPLQEILAYQPNDWMSSFEWRELMQSWLLLWGNAYSLIKPGRRGAVDQLIPLHPSRMVIERLKNGRLRYNYSEPNQTTPTIYTQDQIFHLRFLSQDGVTGYVPTVLCRDAIGLARATELHSGAYFGHGARAGTIIETDQPQKPETLERLRRTWDDMHKGPTQGSKTAVLPAGMHVKELTQNNDTDRLLETRRFQNEAVCMAYRVPPSMIGEMTKSSYNSVEQQSLDFVTFSLIPHLRRWEGACRRDLVVDDKQYFCAYDVNALMAGDYAARSTYFKEMNLLGVLSINEIRSREGLNPIDDGDKRFIQLNMQLLGAFTEANPAGGQAPAAPSGAPIADTLPAATAEGAPTESARSAEVLFRQTLRKLSAIEFNGIIERRTKPAKLKAWLEGHEERMKTELLDAAIATGRDITAFIADWTKASREMLLDCHRSGVPYEEAEESWMKRANLSDD